MSYTVSTLLLRNLHDVFGEIDPVRRRAAIDEIDDPIMIATARIAIMGSVIAKNT
jgi:hypothetical protein